MRLFVYISYKGTNYHGWQFQKNALSIQQEITSGLQLLLKDKTLKSLSTDLTGRLYKQFDTTEVLKTMPEQIEKWLSDKGLK